MTRQIRRSRGLGMAIALIAGLAASPAGAATFAGIDVSLVGNATILQNGDLQLTQPAATRVGTAWATTPVSTTEVFSTSFEFAITASNTFPMGDGLAFIIQDTGTSSIGFEGGGLGVLGLDAVAFVIQTWTNNRVGFANNGNPASAAAAGASLGAASALTGYLTITYAPEQTLLVATGEIFGLASPYEIVTVTTVDLAQRFGPTVYLGFGSGTGGNYADHRITSWTIEAIPEPETYALLLAGLGLVGWKLRHRTA